MARKLQAAGIECAVCGPGLIPRGATDRVKTDRRDAERLVRLLVAGELHRVAVPSVEEEALRDLVGARGICAAIWCARAIAWRSCLGRSPGRLERMIDLHRQVGGVGAGEARGDPAQIAVAGVSELT